MKVVYYLRTFPVLSETFIQREFRVVSRSEGLDVSVISDLKPPASHLTGDGEALAADTNYLFPVNVLKLLFGIAVAGGRSIRSASRIFTKVRNTRCQEKKSVREDVLIFAKVMFLAYRLRVDSVDHIHSPWADTNSFVALLAARHVGITFSVHARAQDLHRVTHLHAMEDKFAAASFVITNTLYNVPFVKSYMTADSYGKIHQIYNGVPLKDLALSDRSNKLSGQQNRPIQLLSVGRLVEQKGYSVLLSALAQLRDDGLDFVCRIVGAPEIPLYESYYNELMTQHASLGLESCVIFEREQPFTSVLSFYRDADIFVLPCVLTSDGTRDIIPNVVLEAMAMKLPVISTTIAGLPEMVDHLSNGILVEPGDAVAVAESIRKLADDLELRVKYGENGRHKVESTFSIDTNADRIAGLFRQLNQVTPTAVN